jgi:hypothetical protein
MLVSIAIYARQTSNTSPLLSSPEAVPSGQVLGNAFERLDPDVVCLALRGKVSHAAKRRVGTNSQD